MLSLPLLPWGMQNLEFGSQQVGKIKRWTSPCPQKIIFELFLLVVSGLHASFCKK